MDAVFMTLIASAAAAWMRAPRSAVWAIVAGLLTSVALAFTFSAAAVLIIGGGALLVAVGKVGKGAAVRGGVLGLGGLALGLAAERVGFHMNLWTIFVAAQRAHATLASTSRPYVYWVVANLLALGIVAGIPQTALFVAELRAHVRGRSFGLETICAVTLLVMTLSGAFKGEVDHIWLFMIPVVAAAAAARLERLMSTTPLKSELQGVAGGALLQTLATQVLLYTYW
jgi:hypothetical protein